MNILSQLIKDNYILMTLVHMAFDILHNVFTIAACLPRPLLVTCISLSSVVWPYKLEATKREQEVVSHGLSCLQFVFV